MKSFECLAARCLQVVYWLMGLLPLPPGSQFIRLLFALLLRCIWSLYFYIMIYSGIRFLWKEKGLTISYITGSALFLGYSMLGVLLQIESIFKQRSQERLQDLRFQSQLQMQRLAMSRGCPRRALRLFMLIATQLVSDAAKFWANSRAKVSPVLAITMPQMWLLRIRYVQLLEQVIEMNQRALQLRHSLLCLADSNDIWQPFGQQDDRHLQTLRLTYDCIFECYETFSDCYGWGMLGLQVMCGFEFVSNAYWIITEAYQDQQLYMLVYNSATCFAMGSLITSLFWYGDASTQNFALVKSKLSPCLVIMKLLSVARLFFQICVCFFGVCWHTSFHRLQLLLLGFWMCWYPVIWTRTATRSSHFDECTLDCLISHTLFLLLTVGHVVVLFDTFVQRRRLHSLRLQQCNYFDHHRAVTVSSCFLIFPTIATQIVVYVSRLLLHGDEGPLALFWIVTPSSVALQFKLFAFFIDVLAANVQVASVRESLVLLARQQSIRQRQRPEVEPLIQLKKRYSELNHLFAQLNLGYGISLLTIFIVFFVSFVFNSYWVVKNLMQRPTSPAMLLIHFALTVNMVLLFSAICWHCQQSYNHSRQIGCLISKLVKPLGSKRYNDLVCEFLLQTLHQRFVLTAKDFFSLNLHLLSSMCAAVVTYLVILIQFMFAEKSSQVVSQKPETETSTELNKLE